MTQSPPPAGLLPLLTVLNANGILAAGMYLPSLPSIGQALQAPADMLPLTLSVYLAAFAVGQLGFGPLSDRWGRRGLLLAGLMMMAAGSFFCAFAGSLDQLLLARAAQGLGAASGMVTGRAVLNDVYERAEAARATSVVSAALAIAPIVSPILGGIVEQAFGWRGNFLASGIVTLAAFAAAYWRLPETHRPGPAKESLLGGMVRSYGFLLSSRAFLTFALVNLAIFAGLHGFNAGSPQLMIGELGLSPFAYGLLAATASAGYFLGALLSSRLVAKLGVLVMIDAGVACMVAGGVGLALYAELFGTSITAIVATRALWAVGMGLALPNTVVSAVGVNRAMLGSAAALSGFLQTSGGMAGSAANSFFPAGDMLSLGLAFGGTAVFGLIVWLGNRPAARASIERPD